MPYQPGDLLREKYRIKALIGLGSFGITELLLHSQSERKQIYAAKK